MDLVAPTVSRDPPVFSADACKQRSEIKSPSGILQTNREYSSFADCVWSFSARFGFSHKCFHMQLSFSRSPSRIEITTLVYRVQIDTLDVEGSINSCVDYLIFYDGPSTSSPRLGTYCGNSEDHIFCMAGPCSPSGAIVTTGGEMCIEFHSNAVVSGAGFKLTWGMVARSPAVSSSSGIVARTDDIFGALPFALGGGMIGSASTLDIYSSRFFNNSIWVNPFLSRTYCSTHFPCGSNFLPNRIPFQCPLFSSGGGVYADGEASIRIFDSEVTANGCRGSIATGLCEIFLMSPMCSSQAAEWVQIRAAKFWHTGQTLIETS